MADFAPALSGAAWAWHGKIKAKGWELVVAAGATEAGGDAAQDEEDTEVTGAGESARNAAQSPHTRARLRKEEDKEGEEWGLTGGTTFAARASGESVGVDWRRRPMDFNQTVQNQREVQTAERG